MTDNAIAYRGYLIMPAAAEYRITTMGGNVIWARTTNPDVAKEIIDHYVADEERRKDGLAAGIRCFADNGRECIISGERRLCANCPLYRSVDDFVRSRDKAAIRNERVGIDMRKYAQGR